MRWLLITAYSSDIQVAEPGPALIPERRITEAYPERDGTMLVLCDPEEDVFATDSFESVVARLLDRA